MPLPDDLRAAIDQKLPPRWSRNNPVDCAGGEVRDTIPEVMELIAAHPDVHAIVYLGLGIQSNQARLMREGGFYPDHGLERIVAYHERQDERFAEAADELSRAVRQADPHRHRAGRRRPRQPRPGGGAGQRAALLRQRQPSRRGARPPRAVRQVPRAARADLMARHGGSPVIVATSLRDRGVDGPGRAVAVGRGPIDVRSRPHHRRPGRPVDQPGRPR